MTPGTVTVTFSPKNEIQLDTGSLNLEEALMLVSAAQELILRKFIPQGPVQERQRPAIVIPDARLPATP